MGKQKAKVTIRPSVGEPDPAAASLVLRMLAGSPVKDREAADKRKAKKPAKRGPGTKAKAIIAGGLLVLAVAAGATERGWRVGGELILPGDSMPEVLRVAGAPDMRNRIESPEGGTVGNRWYYTFDGYNARTVILTFRGGRVVAIRTERR